MAPSKIRKALGTVKDQTSIGLAKVGSASAPDLEVAIVKATSHDEVPADDKYIREILHLTSYSRGYVNACVSVLSRRLGKTHNWIVALKALSLIHRLLHDGDPSFEHEILYATRRGARLLNLSDFRDDSHPSAWDYSAFVRTYALYLDERLDCALPEKKQLDIRSRDNVRRIGYGDYEYSNEDYGSNGYGSSQSGYGYSEARKQEENRQDNGQHMAFRDMKLEMVFDKMQRWQRLLERFLACRPAGPAKCNVLVQVALYPVVRESFQLYADICEGLAILLDRFFDVEYQDCVKAFEIYSRAAKHIDELSSFYGWCKNMGVCRSSEYPEVQRISEKLLETLEDFLRDGATSRNQKPKSPDPVPEKPQSPAPKSEEPEQDMNSIKALPAPGDDEKQDTQEPQLPNHDREGDLLNLGQASISSEEQENKFALALFMGSSESSGTKSWEAFSCSDDGKAGWELALVESASNLSKHGSSFAGGFDHLLLEGLYDQAAARQQYSSQIMLDGSASSVDLRGQKAPSFLALPAPIAQAGEDPFVASLNVPPPSYVQMSDMRRKQELLVQEQQLWQQYQKDGMRGQDGIMKLYTNTYGLAMQNSYGVPTYGMAPYGMGGYLQSYRTSY